jgi:hypothetical protein
MTPRFAAAVGVAAVVAAICLFSFGSDRRVVGTNTIAPMISVELLPEKPVCERTEDVPAGAGVVRVRAERKTTANRGSEPSSIAGLRVELKDSRGRISAGTVFGPREGLIEVPMRPATRAAPEARVCVLNLDTDSLLLFGEQKRPFEGATQAQREVRVGLTFLEDEPSTWFSRAGTIVSRFGYGHAGWVGGWAIWFAGILAIAASMLALWQTVRAASGE